MNKNTGLRFGWIVSELRLLREQIESKDAEIDGLRTNRNSLVAEIRSLRAEIERLRDRLLFWSEGKEGGGE